MGEKASFSDGRQVTIQGNADLSNTTEVSNKAEQMHNENLQALMDALQIDDADQLNFPYLVRGAELYCSCGTHRRRLNLPECHGIYISGNPLMHEEDCGVGDDKNISTFGICQSEENPANKSWLAKTGDKIVSFFTGEEKEEGPEKIMLQTEDGQNVKGYACTPCIVSTWKDAHKIEKIARNGEDITDSSPAALTKRSFLVCAYGGLIEPLTSGQDEE